MKGNKKLLKSILEAQTGLHLEGKQSAAEMLKAPSGKGCIFCDEHGVTVNFSYPYFIEWDRLSNEKQLLWWVRHLAKKHWMTNRRIVSFIDFVTGHKNWE